MPGQVVTDSEGRHRGVRGECEGQHQADDLVVVVRMLHYCGVCLLGDLNKSLKL